ncbi:helix-turn-helix domain-containing protein [Nonomuraea purpurea]|uniref:Helix-turn-helix domain-containing protein n=1 Tax=Nonomuraea purpurea TaxID=1849276 RepID=A0ABV8G1B4_9ACTN
MEVNQLAEAAAGQDPGVGLPAVSALKTVLEELEAMHVSNARAQGWSWEQIADALGVRRQTVHRKHARRTGR